MTDTIRRVEFRPTVNGDAVEKLEHWLEMARAGEIVSVCLCGSAPDGSVVTTFSSTENRMLEVAALSRLLHKMHRQMDEDTRC